MSTIKEEIKNLEKTLYARCDERDAIQGEISRLSTEIERKNKQEYNETKAALQALRAAAGE